MIYLIPIHFAIFVVAWTYHAPELLLLSLPLTVLNSLNQ